MDINPTQQMVASRVLAHAQAKDKNFSFDPWTIMAICNCIISVCKLLYVCYSKESAMSRIKKSSLIHKLLLKREIRKQFKDKSQRKVMFQSMLEVGTSLSQKELDELMESVQE